MSILRSALAVALLLSITSAVPAVAQRLGFRADQEFVDHLEKLVKCERLGRVEHNIYCKLEFRGLSIEFASVNSPGGGALYVHALGKNQRLSTWGSRCLWIEFMDEDLRIDGRPTGVIFRDDGTITYNFNNPAARAKCR